MKRISIRVLLLLRRNNRFYIASCISFFSGTVAKVVDDSETNLEQHSDEISVTQGALEHGYGDVQIWDNGSKSI